mgnify:FL=1
MKGSLSRAPRRPKPSRRRRFGRGRGEHDGAVQKQSDPCRLSGKAIGLGGSSVHKSGKPPHRTAALFPLSGYPAEKRADSPNAVRPLFSISPSAFRRPVRAADIIRLPLFRSRSRGAISSPGRAWHPQPSRSPRCWRRPHSCPPCRIWQPLRPLSGRSPP